MCTSQLLTCVCVRVCVSLLNGTTSEEELDSIPSLALGLGAIAMIPANVAKIQQYGGVAPMCTLLGAIAAMDSVANQEDMLVTFASSITEVHPSLHPPLCPCIPACLTITP